MNTAEAPPKPTVDLTNCDKEPIHIPGSVQPHGAMLVLDEPRLTVLQASGNTGTLFGIEPQDILGRHLNLLMGEAGVETLREQILSLNLEVTPHYLPAMKLGPGETLFEGLAHRHQGLLLLELERKPEGVSSAPPEIFAALKGALAHLHGASSVREFCRLAAAQVRRFTGFDRVMIYQFLEDGSGSVIAEDRRAELESYLGLHYPASDIPKQARDLYLRSWLRLIPDAEATPAPLLPAVNPLTGQPTDMSYAVTRSTSPVHIEYLRNMGVRASMSLSVIKDERLWGLVACHHYSPRYVSHEARIACEFLAHMLSLQMGAKEDAENHEYITHLSRQHARLVGLMSAEGDYYRALTKEDTRLLDWIESGGAALSVNGSVHLVGSAPSPEQVKNLVAWLESNNDDEVFVTDNLAALCPDARACQETASGLLAVRLARRRPEYLLWFRPEVTQTVNWAGDPRKPVEATGDGLRLSPRKSFALWQETVRGKSAPWRACEVESAKEFRRSVTEIVVRKAEALAELNAELERSNVELDSFAYVASHDLKEPLRGINNYSHFLLEDYADRLDEEGASRLRTLVRLTERMEDLLDSLLYYSRVGRAALDIREVDLNEVLAESREFLDARLRETGAQLRVPTPLPTVRADPQRVGEVFSNLIANAVKYNDQTEKWVEVGVATRADDAGDVTSAPEVFYVRDNGIGIAPEHHETIFRIFKRLHGRDKYGGGVGAGLTIVKKIVERHGGRVWLESTPGSGTTFYFTLGASDADERQAAARPDTDGGGQR